MSRTCRIACHDCEKKLWIGQMHTSGWRIYGGDPTYEKNLTDFLNAHEGHRLEFGDSERFDFYEDVEPDDEAEGTKLSDVVIDLCQRAGLTPDIPAIRELDKEVTVESDDTPSRRYFFAKFKEAGLPESMAAVDWLAVQNKRDWEVAAHISADQPKT
jgi:hypothetical protein